MTNLGSTIDAAQPSSGPSTEHPADVLLWTRRLSDSAESIATAAASPGAAAAIASALAHVDAGDIDRRRPARRGASAPASHGPRLRSHSRKRARHGP